jgi:hypothetical protein
MRAILVFGLVAGFDDQQLRKRSLKSGQGGFDRLFGTVVLVFFLFFLFLFLEVVSLLKESDEAVL